jgi:hypothetical protein
MDCFPKRYEVRSDGERVGWGLGSKGGEQGDVGETFFFCSALPLPTPKSQISFLSHNHPLPPSANGSHRSTIE